MPAMDAPRFEGLSSLDLPRRPTDVTSFDPPPEPGIFGRKTGISKMERRPKMEGMTADVGLETGVESTSSRKSFFSYSMPNELPSQPKILPPNRIMHDRSGFVMGRFLEAIAASPNKLIRAVAERRDGGIPETRETRSIRPWLWKQ
mmetsp:Transcript_5629/g.10081  ORF Transcript_5629/g.10081 Transcript_5629/m.10081 type:complete len:146 (+) Transcript_5629:26-463(+)